MTSMVKMPVGTTLLKVDSMGRVRATRSQREAILAEFEQSGLSAARFAALHGIKYQTFAGWRHLKRRSSISQPKVAAPAPALPVARVQLTEVVLSHRPEPDATLQVQLPGGVSFQITNAQQAKLAAQLIRALS